ncbi:MAG: outer membrane beta-barrel protein, partial [Planctomycetes bacterium]|nr:outer membrane beta-barrel protein [Planctomycetota bacterium]
GAAFAQPAEVDVEDDGGLGGVFEEDTSFDPDLALGFRFGYWIDPAPFVGFQFDVSHFWAENEVFELNSITTLTPMVMFRATLFPSHDFPYGCLHPYAGIGPSVVLSDTEVDLRPEADGRVDGFGTDAGLDVRAGLEWLFHPNVGLFVEYRLLYFEQHIEDDDDFFGFLEDDDTADTTFVTHHVMAGISFHF